MVVWVCHSAMWYNGAWVCHSGIVVWVCHSGIVVRGRVCHSGIVARDVTVVSLKLQCM